MGFNLIGRANRDSRFVNDDFLFRHMVGNRSGYRQYILKVSASVIIGWSTNGDKQEFGMMDALYRICREF